MVTVNSASGLADILGRRFGHHKIPYNKNKSFVGSAAMAAAGFLACVGYSSLPLLNFFFTFYPPIESSLFIYFFAE